MTKSQKELVQETFNDDASKWSDWAYDPNNNLDQYPTGKPRIRTIEREIDRFFPGRKLTVLDAGCGTGDVSLHLEQLGHTAHGVDFAPEMVSESRNRYREYFPDRTDADTRFRVGDVDKLPYPDATFDAVFAVGLLEYLPEDDPFFREMMRILVPGGIFLVECRNRLFNAVSANKYTVDEAQSGSLVQLIMELERVQRFSPRTTIDIPSLLMERAGDLRALLSIEPSAGISTEAVGKQFPKGLVRRLFTPESLETVAIRNHYSLQHVVYYHTHWVPPAFEKSFTQFYNAMALISDVVGETPLGAYLGSCFLAILKKPEKHK